jgi:regulator of sirC expression with transglutaminase-like and TPR domain
VRDLTSGPRRARLTNVAGSHVQRAELLADLGRYAEAAAELAGAGSLDAAALTLLARVKLAEGARKEALAAADAAVAAEPDNLGALIARGMVLADLGQVNEAAAQAEQILRLGRDDGYACTSAAAILAEVRNGQVALNAAWEGVRLTPDQPRAHLVLGVVAAQLGMDEVAQRAYREALSIDPNLLAAQAALGVARVEQHRYVQALSHLADRDPPPVTEAQRPSRVPPGRPSPASTPSIPAQPPGPSRPPRPSPAGRLRKLLHYGAGYAMVAAMVSAWPYAVGVGAGVVAMVLGVLGLAGWAAGWPRLAEASGTGLPGGLRAHPAAVAAICGAALAPPLVLLSALVGHPWPLAVAVAAGALSLLATGRLPR